MTECKWNINRRNDVWACSTADTDYGSSSQWQVERRGHIRANRTENSCQWAKWIRCGSTGCLTTSSAGPVHAFPPYDDCCGCGSRRPLVHWMPVGDVTCTRSSASERKNSKSIAASCNSDRRQRHMDDSRVSWLLVHVEAFRCDSLQRSISFEQRRNKFSQLRARNSHDIALGICCL